MIVVILTLALLTQAEAVHYEKIAHLPNPNNFSKSVYSHNYSFFLAYDSSSTKALAYRTYNWQPIDQPILTEFKMPPEHIEYYFSDYHYNFLYYNNDQGQIRRKIVSNNDSSDMLLMNYSETTERIQGITTDGQNVYAFFFENSTSVYIGKTATSGIYKSFQFKDNYPIKSVKWRPDSSELYIVAGDEKQNSQIFLLLNPYTQQQTQIPFSNPFTILDICFSSFSMDEIIDSIILLSSREDQLSMIFLYNLKEKIMRPIPISFHIGISGTIHSQGQIFVAMNEDHNEYIFNLNTQNTLGHWSTELETSGLSPNGQFLIVKNGEFQIYSLCQPEHFFQPFAQQCYKCPEYCSSHCFFDNKYKCYNCSQKYYLDSPYQCQKCIRGCLNCNSSSLCQKCDSANGWKLNTLSQCQCQIGFYMDNLELCKSCGEVMPNCAICNSSQLCQKCDSKSYRGQQNECILCSFSIKNCYSCENKDKCLSCQQGYGLNNQSLCLECSKYIDDCVLCSSLNNCTSCSNTKVALNGTCISCPIAIPGCISCIKDICQKCDSNYLLLNDKCVQCSAVMNGCRTCQSSSICLTCLQGYTLYPNNPCQKCSFFMPGCINCVTPHQCTLCDEDYSINNQTNQCEKNSSSFSIGLVIGVLIGGILLGIFATILFKKCKPKRVARQSSLINDEQRAIRH